MKGLSYVNRQSDFAPPNLIPSKSALESDITYMESCSHVVIGIWHCTQDLSNLNCVKLISNRHFNSFARICLLNGIYFATLFIIFILTFHDLLSHKPNSYLFKTPAC